MSAAAAAALRRRFFASSRSAFGRSLHHRFVSTLIIAEHEGGIVKQSTLSALAAAEVIAKQNKISVLLAGSGPSVKKAAESAASSHPLVSEVLVADAEVFTHPLAESWAELVSHVQKKGQFSHIIAASSSFGKNVLPRAAALLDVSPVTDVINISEPRIFTRPIHAGGALCTVRYTGHDPCIMTVRSTSFSLPVDSVNSGTTADVPISQVDLSFLSEGTQGKSEWLQIFSQDTNRPDLGSARVVVTGGRGLKSQENFKLLEQLADKLGGTVGATRAAVDAGYAPNDLQIGQTGRVVAPELYMAFGVSGAIQHVAGMIDSKVIVAVTKDPDAPILKIADYGLVMDLFDVIPELLEKLPEKK